MRGSANGGITIPLPKSYPPNTGDKSPTGTKILGGKSPWGQKSLVEMSGGQMSGGGGSGW